VGVKCRPARNEKDVGVSSRLEKISHPRDHVCGVGGSVDTDLAARAAEGRRWGKGEEGLGSRIERVVRKRVV
jgi:hypothetical protein